MFRRSAGTPAVRAALGDVARTRPAHVRERRGFLGGTRGRGRKGGLRRGLFTGEIASEMRGGGARDCGVAAEFS
jgi:hypothetical protein